MKRLFRWSWRLASIESYCLLCALDPLTSTDPSLWLWSLNSFIFSWLWLFCSHLPSPSVGHSFESLLIPLCLDEAASHSQTQGTSYLFALEVCFHFFFTPSSECASLPLVLSTSLQQSQCFLCMSWSLLSVLIGLKLYAVSPLLRAISIVSNSRSTSVRLHFLSRLALRQTFQFICFD